MTDDARATGRIGSLDAIRGLASLWVVLHHSWASSTEAIAASPLIHLTPVRFLLSARAPVILFFVLSGFVLSLPYCRNKNQPYSCYLIRRVCRIYLPFAVVVLSSAAIGSVVWRHPVADATPLINVMWTDISIENVIQHLLMTGIVGQTDLDAPMWSLAQEMRVSLCFPLLFLLCRAAGLGWSVTAGGVVFAVSWAVLWYLGQDAVGYYAAVDLLAVAPLTAFFLLPFIIGIVTAQRFGQWVARTSSARVWTRALLWGVVACGICAPSFSPGVDAVYAIAAALLIVLVSSSPRAAVILNVSPIRWLGRVSYSLYLIHLPVLGALACLLGPYVSFAWIAAVAPFFSLALSNVVHHLVEAPSNRLGRRLTSAMIRPQDARPALAIAALGAEHVAVPRRHGR